MSRNRKNFVRCINPKCNASWNIKVRNDCPVCGEVFKKQPHVTASQMVEKFEKGKNGTMNPSTKPVTTKVVNDRDFAWEVKIDTVGACSKAPEKVKVVVEQLAKAKMVFLMKKFSNIEWLAYLLGQRKEDGTFLVTDLFVPKQDITSTSVDNVRCEEYNSLPVVGVIHSHHDMGHQFSGTDDEWINQNHDLSIVISKRGLHGQVRWRTPCGSIKIVDADVKVRPVEFDLGDFTKQVDENIKKKSYTYPAGNYNYNYGGYNYRQNGWENRYPQNVTPGRVVPRQPTTQKTFTDGAITKEVEERFTHKDNKESTVVVVNDKRKVGPGAEAAAVDKDDPTIWNTEIDKEANELAEEIDKEQKQQF